MDYFEISADFNHDLNIGFSASQNHNGKKWEILLGGWRGTRSVIRSGNQEPHPGHVQVTHTMDKFQGSVRNPLVS